MNIKNIATFFCSALITANAVVAQTLPVQATESSPTPEALVPCAVDAAALVGKWDGIWSATKIDAIFEAISVYAKEDKCFLKFKLYQKTKEADSAGYKIFEMHLKQGAKVDFDRIEVNRPTAEIWGTIDKKVGTILINHKRPEFPSAGYAYFKKRTQ